jgi:fatty acid desaturase
MIQRNKFPNYIAFITFGTCILQMYNLCWFEMYGYTISLLTLTICTSSVINFCLHEFIHGYVFPTKRANDFFGFILSLSCGLPIYTILSKGHLSHHLNKTHQDDPYRNNYFNNIFGKRFNYLFYSSVIFTNKWFKLNILLQCLFNYFIFKMISLNALFFLILCTLLSSVFFDTFHEHYYYQTRNTKLRMYDNRDLENHYKHPDFYQPLA